MVPLRDDLTGEAVSHIKQQYPPTPVSHLPGAGPYAMDSYIIFCGKRDEWKSVMPADKELIRYLVCTFPGINVDLHSTLDLSEMEMGVL